MTYFATLHVNTLAAFIFKKISVSVLISVILALNYGTKFCGIAHP